MVIRDMCYYSPLGPAGQVFGLLTGARRVGVVGLGAGAQACLARPGQAVTFFEIDPVVARIARDKRWFSYLADCAPDARVEIGDGRLLLAQWQGAAFDLLVVDAFSSDAIPMHLLTREAMALYLDRLAPGGVLLLHVSNLYLDLLPVVSAAAADLGAVGMAQFYAPDAAAEARGAGASYWAVVARDAAALAPLAADGRWQALRPQPGRRAWTDDFSDLLGALIRN
jgi:spermidine synthase